MAHSHGFNEILANPVKALSDIIETQVLPLESASTKPPPTTSVFDFQENVFWSGIIRKGGWGWVGWGGWGWDFMLYAKLYTSKFGIFPNYVGGEKKMYVYIFLRFISHCEHSKH